ncbi:hypothetical protein [Bradyrhizobium sp.]|nr:hypothetical protein [Bradyrhizobium sp.]
MPKSINDAAKAANAAEHELLKVGAGAAHLKFLDSTRQNPFGSFK